jgi:hypothetical protein
VREPGIAQVVKHDRASRGIALDVQILPRHAHGSKVFAQELGAVFGGRHVKQAPGLAFGMLHQPLE